MGHEASGIIHAVGSHVQSVKVGDRVAIEPGTPCRRCQACKDGFYNLCVDMKFAAAPPDSHGALTKYYLVQEDFVYKIADDNTLQEAVLIEPLSVAVHANRLVNVKPGHDVVIFGSGTIGLLCAAVAKSFGAQRIILIDVIERKLQFAREFLQCETFLFKIGSSPEDTASCLKQEFDMPNGCDVVIEASGAESCVQTGIHALRLGGSYIQTGIGKPNITIPILALSEKELKIHGCFRYGSGDYALAVKLLARRVINLKALVSSVTPFEKATEAWEKTSRGEGIKNLIKVDMEVS
jgi:D-xylulose reductase